MFSSEFRGFDIRSVTVRDPQTRQKDAPLKAKLTKTSPRLEGLEIDNRFVVVFSPLDVSCALENQASLQCKGYLRQDALKIGINVLTYAMEH